MTFSVSTPRRFAWSVLFVLLVVPVRAQEYRVHLDVLGETHFTPSLDRYQDALVASMRAGGLAGTDAVQTFPPYVGLRLYAGKERSFNSPHHAGVVVQLGSTGARTAYRDPEGSVYVDDRVRYRALGLLAEHTLGVRDLYDERPRVPFFYALPMLEWTQVHHEERVTVGTTTTTRATLNALQPALELGGGLRFMRGAHYARVALGAYWRYPARLKGDTPAVQLGTLDDELRVTHADAGAKSDGFGLRLSLGIGLTR